MSVSIASEVRTFLKLKIIKYLKFSKNQERWSDLSTISIEKEVMKNLVQIVLINFAQEKTCKLPKLNLMNFEVIYFFNV